MNYLEPSQFLLIMEINKIPTANTALKKIKKDSKTFYVCHVCGRLSFRKLQMNHLYWCRKHYKQMKKFGRTLDNNPRTFRDKNEITIKGKIAIMVLYNSRYEKIAETIFDSKDLNKVRYTKWRLSRSGEVMDNPKFKPSQQFLSSRILKTDKFVIHINGDLLDNRKRNLSIEK